MANILLTREQAIKILIDAADRDDPFWEDLVQDFYDEKTDTLPTIEDVLYPLGVFPAEVAKIAGYS